MSSKDDSPQIDPALTRTYKVALEQRDGAPYMAVYRLEDRIWVEIPPTNPIWDELVKETKDYWREVEFKIGR
jgi:hypothetical protein